MSAPAAVRRVTPTAVRILGADAERDDWLAARCRYEAEACTRRSTAQGLCDMHYKRLRRSGALGHKAPLPLLDRLMARVRVDPDGCWIWTGNQSDDGYGRIGISHNVSVRAHRAVYRELVGPIPDGLVIDHLCRVLLCVNPEHLDVVDSVENSRRGNGPQAHALRTNRCIRGHEFTEVNTVIRKNGSRACRVCLRVRDQAYRDRRAAR